MEVGNIMVRQYERSDNGLAPFVGKKSWFSLEKIVDRSERKGKNEKLIYFFEI